MKKNLLFLIALLLSSTFAVAQVALLEINGAKLQRSHFDMTSNATKVMKSPKLALAANQRYVGAYVSDELSQNGLGLGRYTSGLCKAATDLQKEILSPYVGMKIVGIRFGLCAANGSSRVFMATNSDKGIGSDVISQNITTTQKGWNTVMLDEPYTIPSNTDFIIGFDYNQKTGSTDAAYPLSCVEEGLSGQNLYIYANISAQAGGSGKGWYNMGNENGNLSIQLIVEGDFLDNYVIPQSFGTIKTIVNKEKSTNVQMINISTSAINNISYTITQDGITSAEKEYNFATPSSDYYMTVPITFTGASQVGNYPITLTITKVNGSPNNAPQKSADGTNKVYAKDLKPVVVMEEFTGTGCGWCPRGIAGMKKAAEKFGNDFIGIAIHQYNQNDPMYNSNYANIGFTGAPSCVLNRNKNIIDPYYGSSNDICDDISSLLKDIADASLTVNGTWVNDGTAIEAIANIEAQNASTYQIAYVVTGDGLYNKKWSQTNYYSKNYASQTGITEASLPDDLKFLYNEKTYCPEFNDVLLASSYTSTRNKAENVSVPTEGSASSTFTVDMNSLINNKKLYPYVNMDKIYVIALLIDPSTKGIVGAAKTKLPTWTTGIDDIINNGKQLTEVARYTIDGVKLTAPQQGLNIVKMSDGSTIKVMVK